MHTQARPTVSAHPAIRQSLLIVESDRQFAQRILPALDECFDVRYAANHGGGMQALAARPRLVVTDLALADGDGLEICRAAKAGQPRPSVLVATANVDRVPHAIKAGCDAVLLKPFAPNLLVARLGRLLRAADLSQRIQHARRRSLRLFAERGRLGPGTNVYWPMTRCPYCKNEGATSFDFSSYRRAWYACLACDKVWIGDRQE